MLFAGLIRRFWRRERVECDLEEEVQSYWDLKVEGAMANGLTRAEAERKVRGRFEGRTQIQHDIREARMGHFLEETLSDIRYAARSLIRTPGFTAFAVLTISLGLGANAAIFSLFDAVLLKASGYAAPERIVAIWEKQPTGGRNQIAGANFLDWQKQAKSFEAMAAVRGATLTLSGAGEPRSVMAGIVSASYFDVFGVKAAMGRTFASGEDQAGQSKVAVLAHRLWMSQFGGDPSVLDQEIELDGEKYKIVGVLPGASEFDRRQQAIWIPLVLPADVARDFHFLRVWAKLKPDASIEQARTEMKSIANGISETYPAVKEGWSVTIEPLLELMVSPRLRLSLQILMWAVAAILMIGCANLANLLLARSTLRAREIALRCALGAKQGRIVRLLLAESMLLSFMGAAVGIGFGYLMLSGIRSILPPFYLPSEANVSMDWRVLGFLCAAALCTGIGFGLAPALQSAKRDTAESLKDGGRSSSEGRRARLARNAFVAIQVAMAFLLLTGGGLLLRSLHNVLAVDTGFNTESLFAGYLPMPMGKEVDGTVLLQKVERMIESVRAVPGVGEAAVASGLPLRDWGDGMSMKLAERPNESVGGGFKLVSPGYFRALQLRLLGGRYLDDRDREGASLALVANESFVKSYFEGSVAKAIGQRILIQSILPNRRGLGSEKAWEIVGVVADEKSSGLENPNDRGTYASYLQNPVLEIGMVVRGAAGPALIPAVRRALAQVEKTQVLDQARMLDEMKSESLAGRRLTVSLLGGFAVLALVLACTGIYAVLSFVTAQRTQELGIRSALGATRADLLRLVIGGGVRPVAIGIGAGLASSIILAQYMSSLLFETQPADPLTLASVCVLFLVVALLACFGPAWRASRIEPMSALRQD